MTNLSYSQSGVNIDEANQAKQQMAKSLQTTEKRVLNKMGAFASLYDINFPEYQEPVLVLKTEEPGSKQMLAFQQGRIESICYDMINHLINDCMVMGAKPLSVQDAVICGKLEKEVVTQVVAGIAKACKEQDCVLTGGETSEQPGMLQPGHVILTSSIVGIVEKSQIIDGSKIQEGDVVLALESSGLHTNGYSLVRALLKQNPDIENDSIDTPQGPRSFMDVVMEPHRCYYQTIKDLFPTGSLHGLAHITGGGIKENLNRILPQNVDATIDLSLYQILPIFKYLKEKGGLPDDEMLRTFNMSVGLVAVTSPADSQSVIDHIKSKGVNCYAIGEIMAGSGTVQTKNELPWA